MKNKFQEALDRLCENNYFDEKGNCNCDLIVMDRILIQKLVDKTTPKKPSLSKIWKDEDTKTIYDEYGHINKMLCVCPNCEESTILDYEYDKSFEHCSNCGQAIDWSDEDA